MKAFIEYPEVSDDRIEVQRDFYVVTRLRLVDHIIEQVEAKGASASD